MLAIRFDFTANRYHATQWGRHVNEGVLEWPPSPWRILRAIVATWQRTLPDLPEDSVFPILETLGSERPLYRLPPASTGHSRHYMPYNEGSHQRTTLVIDSFVAIQPTEPVVAIWPDAGLDQRQTRHLAAILRNMPYLGRAESWVDASITPDYPEPQLGPAGGWSAPRRLRGDGPDPRAATDGRAGGPHGRDLGPQTRRFVSTRRAPSGGCTLAGPTASPRSGPSTVAAVRRAQPPRWCGSHFRATCCPWSGTRCAGAIWRADPRWHSSEDRTAMGSPPRCQEGGESGEPLTGHRHSFYLPTDDDGDGRLDHLTVWAPEGLSPPEFQAIVSMTHLNPGRGREPVQLVYQAHGGVGGLHRRISPVRHVDTLAVSHAVCPHASRQVSRTPGRERVQTPGGRPGGPDQTRGRTPLARQRERRARAHSGPGHPHRADATGQVRGASGQSTSSDTGRAARTGAARTILRSDSLSRSRVPSRWGSPATTALGCSFRQTDPIQTGFLPTTHLNSRIQTRNRPAHGCLVSPTTSGRTGS